MIIVCSLSVHDLSVGVDMEVLEAICNLMEDIRESNPLKFSKEQRSAIKVLLMETKRGVIIVNQYRRLVAKHGNEGLDAKCAVVSGILEFVDNNKIAVDGEAIIAIYDLVDAVHVRNPSLLSKEQTNSLKKLVLMKERQMVREYKRLVGNHGMDAHRQIIEGLLQFVE